MSMHGNERPTRNQRRSRARTGLLAMSFAAAVLSLFVCADALGPNLFDRKQLLLPRSTTPPPRADGVGSTDHQRLHSDLHANAQTRVHDAQPNRVETGGPTSRSLPIQGMEPSAQSPARDGEAQTAAGRLPLHEQFWAHHATGSSFSYPRECTEIPDTWSKHREDPVRSEDGEIDFFDEEDLAHPDYNPTPQWLQDYGTLMETARGSICIGFLTDAGRFYHDQRGRVRPTEEELDDATRVVLPHLGEDRTFAAQLAVVFDRAAPGRYIPGLLSMDGDAFIIFPGTPDTGSDEVARLPGWRFNGVVKPPMNLDGMGCRVEYAIPR